MIVRKLFALIRGSFGLTASDVTIHSIDYDGGSEGLRALLGHDGGAVGSRLVGGHIRRLLGFPGRC